MVWLGGRLLRSKDPDGRSAPERWLGGFFAAFGVGFVCLRVGTAVGPTDAGLPWIIAGQFFASAAFLFLIRFTQRVFRPDDRWAAALAAGLAASVALAFATLPALRGEPAITNGYLLLLIANRLVILGWTFIETTQYALRMRRRVALGLADPVVANRFFLWSLWTGTLCILGIVVLTMLASGVIDLGVPDAALSPAVQQVFAAIAAALLFAIACMWLAFLPPRRYLRWVRARPRGRCRLVMGGSAPTALGLMTHGQTAETGRGLVGTPDVSSRHHPRLLARRTARNPAPPPRAAHRR